MVKRLDLFAGRRKLILEFDGSFIWCKVYCYYLKFDYEIGEISFDSFHKNLINYLRQEDIFNKPIFIIDGKESVIIENFGGLTKKRSNIVYGSKLKKDKAKIFFKLNNHKIRIELELKLTAEIMSQWLERLEDIEKYGYTPHPARYPYKTLALHTKNKALVCDTNIGLSWSEIYIYDQGKFDLGQASIIDIKKRFIPYLRQENIFENEEIDFNGHNIMWFLTIEVKHYALFGTMHEKDCLRIFLMDEHGHILPNPILELSPKTAEIWIHQLESFDLQSPN
ncbi:MAG: hypothetical protein LBV33_05925 [Lachnospiraceae bacterium]|jgi:hypothetical protein|nr:hypothetical protein [Lachnospiraceae bacterium]